MMRKVVAISGRIELDGRSIIRLQSLDITVNRLCGTCQIQILS